MIPCWKTGRLHENVYCIPERRAKKAKKKQYREAKKIRVSIQKMHKQTVKVLESEQRKKQKQNRNSTDQ